MNPNVYTKSYSRALFKYRSNGFFSRPLDADDNEFIARIRETGRCGNGTLAQLIPTHYEFQTSVQMRAGGHRAPDEERDYWKGHWALEPGIERRMGPAPPPLPERKSGVTPIARQRILNRISLVAMREELAREWADRQARLNEERERRILANMLADLEWEHDAGLQRAVRAGHYAGHVEKFVMAKRKLDYRKPAAPQPAPVLVDSRNHYVPEWKVDGHTPAWIAARMTLVKSLDARLEHAMNLIKAREQEKERAATVQRLAEERAIEATKARSKEVVHVPKKVVGAAHDYNFLMQTIKERILRTIRGTSKQWTIEDLMRAVDFNDRALVVRCANELAGGGFIGKNEKDYD